MAYTLIGLVALFFIIIIAPKLNQKAIILLSIFIIANKGIELSIQLLLGNFNKIPIEISTITYFLLPLFILMKKRKIIEVFTFLGFISGIGYLSLFIISGNTLFQLNGLYNTIQGFINHSIILILSIYCMRYKPQENLLLKIWITSFILISYVLIISLLIDYSNQSIFITRVIEGTEAVALLDPLFAKFSIIIYYILILSFYHLTINLYIIINKRYAKALLMKESLD